MAQTIAQYQVNGATPSTVGGTGTGIKCFPNLPGPSIGVSNLTPTLTGSNSTSNPKGQLDVPGSNRLNGQQFHVLASGNFEVGAGGACPNVTIGIYANTGTKVLGGAVITTLAVSQAITTQSLDGVFYPWYVDVTLQGDTQSGIVQGNFTGKTDGTVWTNSSNILTNNLSAVNFSTTEPAFGLIVGVTFSVSESGNSANLFQLRNLSVN